MLDPTDSHLCQHLTHFVFFEELTFILKNKDIDNIDLNLIYFLSNKRKYKNLEALTQVSSLNHYEDLKKRIIKTDKSLKVNSSIKSVSFINL